MGKIRLSLTPWLNHSWQVPLYVSVRGLTTSPIPIGYESLEIEFDFIAHSLLLRTSRGEERSFPLQPESVADFYKRTFQLLRELDIDVAIHTTPNELANPIPFPEDTRHASFDADAAHRFWRVLLQADRVFKHFRTGFLGKASPIHFFWGSFDLAVTRYSGRPAPLHAGGIPGLPDAVTREAYSHEESSVGFWPGTDAFPQAAFYSYAYPEPPTFRDATVKPGEAAFDKSFGEFMLPYEAVRSSASPDDTLLEFLQSTYAAAADRGRWDRAALECSLGVPGQVRAV